MPFLLSQQAKAWCMTLRRDLAVSICGDSAYIYVSSMTCNWNYNIHTLKYKINYMYIYINMIYI